MAVKGESNMYEGKEVFYETYSRGRLILGLVVGCIEKVGITIVEADKPERILYCLRCENSGKFNRTTTDAILENRKRFQEVAEMIRTGYVDISKNTKHIDYAMGISSSKCAFS
jgi:hypothetical protein